MITYGEKLDLIRNALKQNGIDAYLITIADPHMNSETADHWKIIHWLTGFTGSAATVVITDSFAGLWTDSRYIVQASLQLYGSEFQIIKTDITGKYSFSGWMLENISEGGIVALDGKTWSVQQYRNLKEKLFPKGIIIDPGKDLISDIWTDRPALPSGKVFDHKPEYAGRTRLEKITRVREEMKKASAEYHLLTSPDDIMWLLNIRGNDMIHDPVILSYALVGMQQVILFTEENKIPEELKTEFDRLDIIILPYDEITGILSALDGKSRILLSPETTSFEIFSSVPDGISITEDVTIPSRLKAVKNNTEIGNICRTMVKDGVALTKFLHFVEASIGHVPMTEASLTVKLHEYRSGQEGFLGPSFPTIMAFNEHSALPHYTPSKESDMIIEENGILLVDSGGHYPGGTTDITRTVCTGVPTSRQKTDFTLVLKGHISLAIVKFPFPTRGYQLDILARRALWQYGLNYGHGTGHGVGYCLSVHEGPQNISPAENKTPIEQGMLVSNEPALYREGEYGIRTENLMICYEDEETDFGHFLRFDTVSLCYIDRKLIDRSLLDKKETEWLNSYHSEVFEKLNPFLNDDEKEWLRDKTDPI